MVRVEEMVAVWKTAARSGRGRRLVLVTRTRLL
jgi:hypothetical protein